MSTASPIDEDQTHAEGCTCDCNNEPSLIRILDLSPCDVSPQTSSSTGTDYSVSSSTSGSSDDSSARCTLDTDFNCRVKPHWPKYREVLERGGFALDTHHAVSAFYRDRTDSCENQRRDGLRERDDGTGTSGYHKGRDDDSLCHDPGLPCNLFRGTRLSDGTPVVVKAVHQLSRELALVRFFGLPQMREEKMNHCIPILGLIDVDPEFGGNWLEDTEPLGLIVMEEWSSQLIAGTPRTLELFLDGLRQCIEHIVFMHRHHVAHLDISLHNFLTDYKGRYACIDYELSDRFEPECPHLSADTHSQNRLHTEANIKNNSDVQCDSCSIEGGACQRSPPRILGVRGTEVPPELERGLPSDPFKVDIWALGMLIVRCCKKTGYDVPELRPLVKAMVSETPERRPSAKEVLEAFERLRKDTSLES